MSNINHEVDIYFADGCGRCSLGGTPACKVHLWADALAQLRMIALDSELVEERKWGVPCYTFRGKNVLMIGAFKDNCVFSFLKGSLINDVHNLLVKPGENSQSAKIARFTDMQQVIAAEPYLRQYIREAIELEKSGAKVELKKAADYDIPEELQVKFAELPAFRVAFEALTPGRQRGYLIHFAQAKQPQTRIVRIEKYIEKIFEGKGMMD